MFTRIKMNCWEKMLQLPPYIPTTVCRRARRPQKTQQRRVGLQVVATALNVIIPRMSQKAIEREWHHVSQKASEREWHHAIAAAPLKTLTEGIKSSKWSIFPKEYKQ